MLVDLAIFCGAVITILTAVTLIGRLPPTRWLWRTLVSRPLGAWTSDLIADGAKRFHQETVKPAIDGLEVKVDELVTASKETSWHKDKSYIVGRVTKLELGVENLERSQANLVRGVVEVLTRPEGFAGGPGEITRLIVEALNGAILVTRDEVLEAVAVEDELAD